MVTCERERPSGRPDQGVCSPRYVTTVALDGDLNIRLRRFAEEKDRSISWIMREAAKRYLEAEGG